MRKIRLHFEKIASSDRIAEPTYVSLPLPQGMLSDERRVRVMDGKRPLPVQTRVLSRWPDSTIRWLMVAFQADLPGNASKDLFCDFEGQEPPPLPHAIRIEEEMEGWRVDTGPLQAKILRERFDLLHEVRLDGAVILSAGGMESGFFYEQSPGPRQDILNGRVESAEWVERGPIRARLAVRGVHGDSSGAPGLKFRVSIEFYVGKPWIKLQYQAVLADPREQVTLRRWGLRLAGPNGERANRCTVACGHYRDTRVGGAPEEPKHLKINGEFLLYAAYEHIPECYCCNTWTDWTCSKGGIALSLFQAYQNFPKAIHSSPTGLEIDLLPPDEPPLTLRRGVGKTHVMQLHFHPPDTSLEEIGRRSFLFQLPDLPRLDTEIYVNAGVMRDSFPTRRFDRLDYWIHSRAQHVPRAFGMLHYGDYVEESYTGQGRGKGRPIWCNGEYDVPHLYYALHCYFGERWLRDHAAVAARHWMDVDFCHDSDDPLRRGGLIFHSADHVSGSVGISHEWLLGLLDHYHFTGEEEALETAIAIGENILRHLEQPRFRDHPNESSTREMGWALRALGPLWQETGDSRYREACERIANAFISRFDAQGGIQDAYTGYNLGRIPFMIALTMESLRQWAEISGDARARELIVNQARDLLENAFGLGGFTYYKELPSLHRREPVSQMLFPLSEAYRLTREERFLRAAYRIAECILAQRPSTRRSVTEKRLFEDALLMGGEGWAAYEIEPLLFFYATFADVKDSEGKFLLEGLDFRTRF